MLKEKNNLAVKAITEDAGMNDTSTNSNLLENFTELYIFVLPHK